MFTLVCPGPPVNMQVSHHAVYPGGSKPHEPPVVRGSVHKLAWYGSQCSVSSHTMFSSSWSRFPRREQSPPKRVLPNSLLILRNTAGRGSSAQVPQSAAGQKAHENLQQAPNKATVCGVLDESLLAEGGKRSEFLLNKAHSESSQALLDSVPGDQFVISPQHELRRNALWSCPWLNFWFTCSLKG